MQLQTPSLPDPDDLSAAHSALVAGYIRGQIAAAGGVISFAEFMQHALYAPGLGYYSAGSAKFGKDGDFVTAPEVSPIFGRVLARQCAEVLRQVETPSILEFGAGSGKLAADILRELADLDALPPGGYKILEVSADLRERQQQCLRREIPELLDQVCWLDQLPDRHAGVIIANEVLDALPVERFVRHAASIAQVCVVCDGQSFSLGERNAPENLVTAVELIEDDLGEQLPDGFASEICLAAPQWIAQLGRILSAGGAFLFDYGVSRREYYSSERSGGWLRCHFRHHAHNDPLILAGIQDITAWVDFSAIAVAAVSSDLEIDGYTSQSQFLIGAGLEQVLTDFQDLPIETQINVSSQVKLLTLPAEMGENFKCIGLSRGIQTTPTAFAFGDRTASL